MCPGISEKFGVMGAQGSMARTESDEPVTESGRCSCPSAHRVAGARRGQRLIPPWTEVGAASLSDATPTSMGRDYLVPPFLIINVM